MRWIDWIALVAMAAPASASDWYVDAVNGNDANNGSSPGSAWKTITFAMGHVPSGAQTIHVAPGTCSASSGETFPIQMKRDVALIGAGQTSTVIDGGGSAIALISFFSSLSQQGPGFTQSSKVFAMSLRNAEAGILAGSDWGDVGHHVADVTIEGMSQAGHMTNTYDCCGTANVLLERVTVRNCQRALYAYGRAVVLTVRDSSLRSNAQQAIYAKSTGGISLRLERCALEDNGASAVETFIYYIYSVFLRAEDCSFSGNAGSGWDGTDCRAQAKFWRCTFTQNAIGVGTCGSEPTNLEMHDSIVYGNGDDILTLGLASHWVEGCDIGDGDYSGQNGTFSADPLFVDVAAHDYRLAWSSPCIDAALALPDPQARDLAGHARDVDGDLDTNERADLGAFEFRPLEIAGTAQLGTLIQWQLWGPQGNATTLYWTRSAVAGTPSSTPFGQFDLVPNLAHVYRVTTAGASAPTVLQRSIPNAPSLVGQTFAFQSLTDCAAAPNGRAYTNAVQFTILP